MTIETVQIMLDPPSSSGSKHLRRVRGSTFRSYQEQFPKRLEPFGPTAPSRLEPSVVGPRPEALERSRVGARRRCRPATTRKRRRFDACASNGNMIHDIIHNIHPS